MRRRLPAQPEPCRACGRRPPLEGITCACQARTVPLAAGNLAALGVAVARGPAAVLAFRDQRRAARLATQLGVARGRRQL